MVKSCNKFEKKFVSSTFDLPSEQEICTEIEICRNRAVNDAVKIGILNKKMKKENWPCKVNPYVEKNGWKNMASVPSKNPIQPQQILAKNLSLKDYSDKFEHKAVDEASIYVEIKNEEKRIVVKKTSLCWMMRKDYQKISSDRLIRVQLGGKYSGQPSVKSGIKAKNKSKYPKCAKKKLKTKS